MKGQSNTGEFERGVQMHKVFVYKVGMVKEAQPCHSAPTRLSLGALWARLAYKGLCEHDQIIKDGIGRGVCPKCCYILVMYNACLVTCDQTTKGLLKTQY